MNQNSAKHSKCKKWVIFNYAILASVYTVIMVPLTPAQACGIERVEAPKPSIDPSENDALLKCLESINFE